MSTASLPRYTADTRPTPMYSAEPPPFESQHPRAETPSFVASAATARPPGGQFVKESKGGNLRLRLYRQTDNATVPVFGIRGPVEGTLQLSKPKGLVFVAVRVGISFIGALSSGI